METPGVMAASAAVGSMTGSRSSSHRAAAQAVGEMIVTSSSNVAAMTNAAAVALMASGAHTTVALVPAAVTTTIEVSHQACESTFTYSDAAMSDNERVSRPSSCLVPTLRLQVVFAAEVMQAV